MVSFGDNLHEMPRSILWRKKKNIVKCLVEFFFTQHLGRYKIFKNSNSQK